MHERIEKQTIQVREIYKGHLCLPNSSKFSISMFFRRMKVKSFKTITVSCHTCKFWKLKTAGGVQERHFNVLAARTCPTIMITFFKITVSLQTGSVLICDFGSPMKHIHVCNVKGGHHKVLMALRK